MLSPLRRASHEGAQSMSWRRRSRFRLRISAMQRIWQEADVAHGGPQLSAFWLDLAVHRLPGLSQNLSLPWSGVGPPLSASVTHKGERLLPCDSPERSSSSTRQRASDSSLLMRAAK